MSHQAQDKVTRIHAGRIDSDMNFNEKVWALTARIPAGQVTTYALIARTLDSTGYRAVGQALHRNPYAPAIPCHRVVGSDGKLTGYAFGVPKKEKMLRNEGVRVENGKVPVKAIKLFDFK